MNCVGLGLWKGGVEASCVRAPRKRSNSSCKNQQRHHSRLSGSGRARAQLPRDGQERAHLHQPNWLGALPASHTGVVIALAVSGTRDYSLLETAQHPQLNRHFDHLLRFAPQTLRHATH
ncbi:hypothetical protein VTI74DRAFT_5716 [Chaetomium olivicolor]